MSGGSVVGRVRSGKSKRSYEVKWDSSSQYVYVKVVALAGWSNCGKAGSAGEAMRVAEAFLFNR